MAIRIRFDSTGNAIAPTFVLSNRNGNKFGHIPAQNIHVSDNFSTAFESAFDVYKEYNGEKYPNWGRLEDFALAYCPEIDLFLQLAVELDDSDSTIKHVSALSVGEAELSQINLYNVEINTETDILREDYKPTVLFDENDPKASLLNRLLDEKAPHYTIRHVDASIAKIQRTFSFDEGNIYDILQEVAQEINCLVDINSGSNELGQPAREISLYDLESYCMDCKKRGDFLNKCPECGSENVRHGYGEDTTIFISTDNLADEIRYSTDVDSVKNCFKLQAGDDLMTAAIVSCNPNGSGYIWYLSDNIKKDMSDELVSALEEYDKKYAYYQSEYEVKPDAETLAAYNALVTKYKPIRDDLSAIHEPIVGYANLMNVYFDTIDMALFLQNELMPSVKTQDTDAQEQAELLNSTSLSPVAVTDLEKCSESTAKSAVLAIAKTIIDRRYRVKVISSTYSNGVWYGSFSVTNYSDETDTADTELIRVSVNDNYEDYIRQRLTKSVNESADNPTDINGLFALELDKFKKQITKYCLTRLQGFADSCQGCLNILIEQGIANDDAWDGTDEDLYNAVYLPYYNKLKALEEEIYLREEEIATVVGKYEKDGVLAKDGMQTIVQKHNDQIHEELNFEKALGSNLWKELVAYRRDDTYSNENYISDGLSNKEIFNRAREFIEIAQKEIVKSATLQHSISSTLKNLLVMKEFSPIVYHFSTGNWIRVRADENVYRLRLLSYDINFNDLTMLPVVFSDVTKTADGTTDSESVFDQVSSMATSYDSIKRQASQGNDAKKTLDGWVDESLALTKMKIVDSADNQNITWDSHGLLCREYLPITDDYDEKQLKIINRGMYLTDDDWLTSRAGVGDFQYYDPESGEIKSSYGVIADTLVGNLILSKKVGIYNTGGSISMDEDGFVMTTNGENIKDRQKVFIIRRKDADANGVETLENLLYVDNSGNLNFKGTLHGANGEFTGHIMATSLNGSYFKVDAESMGFYSPYDSPLLYYENGTMMLHGSIKTTSKDGSYFVVDSSTMGFYTEADEPMLYYEDGMMILYGAIKAVGVDGSYFQVDNDAMGFFDEDGNPLLSYTNGGLTLTGVVNATSLNIVGDGKSMPFDEYIGSNGIISDLKDRVETVELKVQDDQIVMAVRNSTAYKDDLAAIAVTDDRILSIVESSTAFDNMQTQIDQQSDRINLMATKEELNGSVTTLQQSINTNTSTISTKISSEQAYSLFEQSLSSIKLEADQIDLHGYVTANGNFSIDMDGNLTAKNGVFTGSFSAGYWTFDSGGSLYDNGSINANMTVLTGGGYVGGGSSTRVFYGSSGCDVQYGADYDYNCIIRANTIKIISQVGSVEDFRSVEFKKISSWNDMTFVCGESEGAGEESGNIGSEDQPWDSLWVRKQHRGDTDTTYSSRTIKRDIVDMEEMGDMIDNLKPVRFKYNWESDEKSPHHGLIYEDTLPVYPDICDIPKEGQDIAKHAGIMYEELIAVFLKEIQSLRKRVAMLEAQK